MNPLTYLGFTIFSIIMQFSVMEFIHERILLDKDTTFNESVERDSDLIQNINRKPHALFYRTETNRIAFEKTNKPESLKYSNSSLEDMTTLSSTDISSTTFEVFYENSSIFEDFFTTESYATSSEFDNITEITFLDKSNTTNKQSPSKKVTSKERCLCNLLYQQCDINCCCDTDCTEEQRSLFINCGADHCDKPTNDNMYFCKSYATCSNLISTDAFNDLFCIAKVNVPNKRIKSHYKLDAAALNASYKWNTMQKIDTSVHYKNKKYEYGDPVILLKNETILFLNLPTKLTSNYCNGNKPMKFLINENIKCNIKVKDLYMFPVLKTLEQTKLTSVTELSMNSTVLNCSILHCTNWKILACNQNFCGDYNKTLNVPSCVDNFCNNIAHAMDFIFYYFESKIINATVKLYLATIPTSVALVTQEISVKWYLGNESIDDVIQLSGNPGYIPGMPLILSLATDNHTSNFFNQTSKKKVLTFPLNVGGQCNWNSRKNRSLLFGANTRYKCRLRVMKDISHKNATNACQAIQIYIKELLNIDQNLFLSPYGNPRDVNDDEWMLLEMSDKTFLYGEIRLKNSQLMCYNLVTRYAFVIAYADVSAAADRGENKIVKATVGATQTNVTFDLAELSITLTIDVNFIDISKPLIEIARAPYLGIHLPANFFFDQPSNKCNHLLNGHIVLVLHCVFLLMKK